MRCATRPTACTSGCASGTATAPASWRFVSDQQSIAASLTSEIKLNVTYVQTTGRLSEIGYHLARDYQPIFGLSDSETAMLLEYMRYWTPLRQCCGTQMSADWLATLRGYNASVHKPHHERTSPAYPACEVYDIDGLERALVRTIQRFATRHGHPAQGHAAKIIGSLSETDGMLNGTYCSAYTRACARGWCAADAFAARMQDAAAAKASKAHSSMEAARAAAPATTQVHTISET